MKADIRWLDDPQVFRVNRLDAHSDHKFYENKEDYEKNKNDLERKSTKYTIIEEIENHESITVKLKKQYNGYPCGNYMN